MVNSFVPREYNNVLIRQREIDGFLDATAIAKAGNKSLAMWWKTRETLDLFNALARRIAKKKGQEFKTIELKSSEIARLSASRLEKLFPGLVQVKSGSPENGGGTWLHPKLSIPLAQWVSADFALEVSDWVEEILTRDGLSLAEALAKHLITDKPKNATIHYSQGWRSESLRIIKTRYPDVRNWHADIRVANFINESVYNYFPSWVKARLEEVNPLQGRYRLNLQHQHFEKDFDTAKLQPHIDQVLIVMKTSKSWHDYWTNMQSAFGDGIQLDIDFGGENAT